MAGQRDGLGGARGDDPTLVLPLESKVGHGVWEVGAKGEEVDGGWLSLIS